jgi:stress-induced morphogen
VLAALEPPSRSSISSKRFELVVASSRSVFELPPVRLRRPAWRPVVARYDRGMSTQPLRDLLERAFPDATELDVIDRTGGGDHFQVVVTSQSLAGLSLVEQHRRVYEALSAPLADGTIHELRIKTKGAS